MTRIILIFVIALFSLSAFSVDIDTITPKIIVLNEGYDRVSAIKTSKGIVIIDTHKSVADMKRMRKEIINYFHDSNFVYIINTHQCQEHITGNSLFPNTPKIAHANFAICVANPEGRLTQIDKYLKDYIEKNKDVTDSVEINKINARIKYCQDMKVDVVKAAVPPDISFEDTMSIDLGDITIKLTYIGKGAHGICGHFIYIPEENTLFTGSTLAMPPIIYPKSDWNPEVEVEKWLAVIDKHLEDTLLEHIVPSHIHYYIPDDLKEMRDYYALISTTLKESIQKDLSKEETFKSLDYKMINECFTVFTDEEKSAERHRSNLENLWGYYVDNE